MKKAWLIAVVAALLPLSAQAADIQPYASVGIGMFELDPGQDKKLAFGSYVGLGAELHELLDVEARVGATRANNSANKSKINWLVSLLAKPKVQVARDITVYGLLGATMLKASYTRAGAATQSKTATTFTYGVGGSYTLTDLARVAAEWTRYSSRADVATKNTNFGGLNVNGFVLSLNYDF